MASLVGIFGGNKKAADKKFEKLVQAIEFAQKNRPSFEDVKVNASVQDKRLIELSFAGTLIHAKVNDKGDFTVETSTNSEGDHPKAKRVSEAMDNLSAVINKISIEKRLTATELENEETSDLVDKGQNNPQPDVI